MTLQESRKVHQGTGEKGKGLAKRFASIMDEYDTRKRMGQLSDINLAEYIASEFPKLVGEYVDMDKEAMREKLALAYKNSTAHLYVGSWIEDALQSICEAKSQILKVKG